MTHERENGNGRYRVITAKYAYNKSNLKKSRFKKTCRNFAG